MENAVLTDAAVHSAHPMRLAGPPSELRAFQLSAPDPQVFSGAWADADCNCDRVKQETYASYRLFGTELNRKLAQAQGDVPPVQLWAPDGTYSARYVNYAPLEAAVEGRGYASTCSDTYRDDYAMGFRPASEQGFVAATPRPEQMLHTVSMGLSTVRGGEMLNPRPFYATTRPSSMNLTSVSESAASRAENACRLNRLNHAVVEQKLKSMQAVGW